MNDSKFEQREVTVPTALQAHRMRQYLRGGGVEVTGSRPGERGTETILTFDASPEQWVAINQWIEKTKVQP